MEGRSSICECLFAYFFGSSCLFRMIPPFPSLLFLGTERNGYLADVICIPMILLLPHPHMFLLYITGGDFFITSRRRLDHRMGWLFTTFVSSAFYSALPSFSRAGFPIYNVHFPYAVVSIYTYRVITFMLRAYLFLRLSYMVICGRKNFLLTFLLCLCGM